MGSLAPSRSKWSGFLRSVSSEEGRKGVAHIECGTYCAERIVVVYLGDTKHADNGVTDELLNHSAVPFYPFAHQFVVSVEDTMQHLGVQAFGQLSRSDEITEQRGHGTPIWDPVLEW